MVRETSKAFLGPSYNLLTNNCNHFSSALCERLTGRKAPGWMNRAAGIGVCLPCFVPREWTGPVTIVEADEAHEGEEERRALLAKKKREGGLKDKVLGSEDLVTARRKEEGGVVRDEEGRALPGSETTPLLGMVG